MMTTRWYVETHWVINVVKHSTDMSVLCLVVCFTYFVSCLKRLTLCKLKMQRVRFCRRTEHCLVGSGVGPS